MFHSELPHWFHNWEKTGLILWFDDGDGRARYSNREDNEITRRGSLTEQQLRTWTAEHERWKATEGREGVDARGRIYRNGMVGPDRDIIVLATPEMAELADWIIALVAAGGLAAALSTASGLPAPRCSAGPVGRPGARQTVQVNVLSGPCRARPGFSQLRQLIRFTTRPAS